MAQDSTLRNLDMMLVKSILESVEQIYDPANWSAIGPSSQATDDVLRRHYAVLLDAGYLKPGGDESPRPNTEPPLPGWRPIDSLTPKGVALLSTLRDDE